LIVVMGGAGKMESRRGGFCLFTGEKSTKRKLINNVKG